MSMQLNSLRMNAERDGQHISGAERLLRVADLESAAVGMLQRALLHPRGTAETIRFHVEPISAARVNRGRLLDFSGYQVESWQQGRQLASQMLVASGISQAVADGSIAILAAGASPDGHSMRGAMLIDADSGERLEFDQARGVRASRMDLDGEARQQLYRLLDSINLNNPHVVEALILATKVSSAPGLVAELCWSDDPDYLAGYVASQQFGYQRISLLKPAGEERGGRVFFVRRAKAELPDLVEWLEKSPLLIDRVGQVRQPIPWKEEL